MGSSPYEHLTVRLGDICLHLGGPHFVAYMA